MTAQIKTQRETLLEAVETYGSPLYFYDANKIIVQIENMRNAFKGVDLKLKYACKALTNINVLKLMNKHGVDVDVVSVEEAQIALRAGYAPTQIQYTPSGVSFSEIEEAVSLGIRMNLDSLQVIEQFGEQFGSSMPICLRVNPSIMGGGNAKISVGHANSKFGIPYQQFDKVAELVNKYDLKVTGLHQHTGSDFKNADVIIDAAEVLYKLAMDHFPELEFIDLGSGFKVAYSADDYVTDMESLGKKVVESFNAFTKRYGKPIQLWFEPGKYLVSECGYLLTKATVIKYNPSVNFVGIDSGLNHLIRPMMYDAYHEIENLSNSEGEKKKYNVVGYICENDTFGEDRMLNEVSVGDVISIKNAGAYAFSMASNYNSRVRPAEVMLYNNELKLIRRRETLEDILETQIEVL
ncbi:MAG: diaminopimelate decarboxylase [Spirosomataceae bacterium]